MRLDERHEQAQAHPLPQDEVVSRMPWKFPGGVLRACEGASDQAARSRDIGPRGCERVSRPEARGAQSGNGTVSAQGSTVRVLIRRRNSSLRRSMALVVRADFHCDAWSLVKVKRRSPVSSRLSATARHLSRHLREATPCGGLRSRRRCRRRSCRGRPGQPRAARQCVRAPFADLARILPTNNPRIDRMTVEFFDAGAPRAPSRCRTCR